MMQHTPVGNREQGSEPHGAASSGALIDATAGARGPAKGFADLDEELAVDSVEVTGAIPPWLTGSLVRVTPARFDLDDNTIRHWFDGLAMLHRFGFQDGNVSYANRFLDTEAYRRAKTGSEIGQGFATDPCRAIYKRFQTLFSPDFTDNANVNLMRLGERYVAMTETPLPVEFDPETLATLRRAGKAPGEITTAHPHHDRDRNEAVNYAAHLGPRSTYRVFTTDAQGNQRVVAKLPVKEPSYMHSFGMTERFVILAEYPLVVNPLALALGGKSFIETYRWKPERGTRFHVVDRHTGKLHAGATAGAFFCFHHVNAYEEGDGVVVDLIAYDDAEVIDNLYIDTLRANASQSPNQLRRYRITPGSDAATKEVLLDRSTELPRIDYARFNTKPYRTVYACSVHDERTEPDFLNELIRFDIDTRATQTWHEPGCYPGEPVFVKNPHSDDADDGAILSVVFDSQTERSFLLVLDAATFEERARAQAPHHVPLGFHGQYFGAG